MRAAASILGVSVIAFALLAVAAESGQDEEHGARLSKNDRQINAHARGMVEQGRDIFRFDTFGDEAFWTDTLRMHEVIAAAVDPVTALSVGLKVDADALPSAVVKGIKDGSVDLTSPATTIALLKLNAVVGVIGTVENVGGTDRLTRVGITCALCHSSVDDSFALGIGRRLDGWPNRDLNPGAIIALSAKRAARPAPQPSLVTTCQSSSVMNGISGWSSRSSRSSANNSTPRVRSAPGPASCGLAASRYQSQNSCQANW